MLIFGAVLVITQLASAAEQDFNLVSPVPGIYVHLGKQQDINEDNGGDIANIGFIVGDTSVMAIDPGGSPFIAHRLLHAIKAKTNLPISHTVLTHLHPDHVLGSNTFKSATELIAHRRYPDALAQRGTFYSESFAYLLDGQDESLAQPDRLVSTTMTIDLGNRPVVITAHPTAHTDNDLSVFDIKTQTLWASDLVFAERVPSLDGSIVGWVNITQSWLKGNAKLIIPGHGTPGDKETLLKPQLRYLEKLLHQTRNQIAADARLTDAVKTVASDEVDEWLLFEGRHQGNVTKAFTELEWE